MKCFFASALIVGVSTFGMTGCDQTTQVKDEKTIKTPTGTETITNTTDIKKTGDAKEPAPTPAPDAPK